MERTDKAVHDDGDKLAAVVQKNQKTIWALLIALVVVAVGCTAFFVIRGVMNKNQTKALEDLITRYEEHKAEAAPNIQSANIDTLVTELNDFAAQAPAGYIGAKAWSVLGTIYSDQKKWPDAETAFRESARKGPKVFLAPVSLYNAGIAAEEQEKPADAISRYEECLGYDDFPQAGRAQFAIGRLNETLNEKDKALEAYRKVADTHSADAAWANLAQSRIIALELGL
jgi:tetratricopeptide (TPR) repeat protein